MNTGKFWKDTDVAALVKAYIERQFGQSDNDFALHYSEKTKFTRHGISGKLRDLKKEGLIPNVVRESPYPSYTEPLVMEGDALIMTDLEVPFHHAEFVNRCLELASKWKITNLILGGDLLHFDSLSGWDKNWVDLKHNGLSDNDESKLWDFANSLSSSKQEQFAELIVSLGKREEHDGASTELKVAKKAIRAFEQQFERIDLVLGNHEGRLLRALGTALSPKELTSLLQIKDDDPRWRTAPYYYSVLISGKEKFQIEHPRNTGKFSATRLVNKYHCHVIMGHSHQLNYTFDTSGKYYAIETGHCVDENRLPYAAQRHNVAPAHVLGACIVRGGTPWLLHPKVDWKALARA